MDTHRLRISVSNMRNANTRQQLEHIKLTVLRNLGAMDAAPSAQLAPRPPAFIKVLLQALHAPALALRCVSRRIWLSRPRCAASGRWMLRPLRRSPHNLVSMSRRCLV